MDAADLTVSWPVGPDYPAWVGLDGAGADSTAAWVAFKLKSANFYIDTLEKIGSVHGYSRLVGIEMALDGALASMCGAFDASVAGVIRASTRYFQQGQKKAKLPWKVVPEHQYGWAHCRKVIGHLRDEEPRVASLDPRPDVDRALTKEPAPLGWLTELQRLRNRTIHQQSLSRFIAAEVGGGDALATWTLNMPVRAAQAGIPDSARSEEPVRYLRAAHRELERLTAEMVRLVDSICPHGIPIARQAYDDE